MPSHLAQACTGPAIKAGDDLRSAAARLASAFTTCKRRHRDTLAFYEALKVGLAGK